MEAALAAPLPPKVLHHVGEIDLGTRDPSRLERVVENPPRRSDERMALDVLAVPGLLADEHEPRILLALATDGLRGLLPQIAGLASGRGLTQRIDGELPGDEFLGRKLRFVFVSGHKKN
jgi:hypothetical protein